MLNIITSFYIPINDKKREMELKKTLHRNISNQFIEKIHLFLDNENDLKYIENIGHKKNQKNEKNQKTEKIKIIQVGKQPLYSDLFSYANNLKGKICMICNGDIWIHRVQYPNFILNTITNNVILSLTRHEKNFTKPLIDNYYRHGSHDAFIFKSPLKPNMFQFMNFKQNIWGSENRIMAILHKYGYKLINSCLDFIIIHEHDDKIQKEKLNKTHARASLTSTKEFPFHNVVPSKIVIKGGRIFLQTSISPVFQMDITRQ